jgi:hypothetical protein
MGASPVPVTPQVREDFAHVGGQLLRQEAIVHRDVAVLTGDAGRARCPECSELGHVRGRPVAHGHCESAVAIELGERLEVSGFGLDDHRERPHVAEGSHHAGICLVGAILILNGSSIARTPSDASSASLVGDAARPG